MMMLILGDLTKFFLVLQLDADDDDIFNDNRRLHQVLLGLLWIGAGAVALVRLLQEQVAVTEILTSQSRG